MSAASSPMFNRVNSTSSLSSLEDGGMIPTDRISVLDLLDSFSVSTQITKRLNTTVRQKSVEIKDMAIRHRDRVIRSREADIEKIKLQLLKRVERVERVLANENVISTTEKMTFAIGILNIFFIGFLMGDWPELVHVVYTIELCFLFPIRVYSFRKKDYHYFLADLCYFVNFLCMMFIWACPSSEQLYISCYALCFGTLSWAVITWRNSLVLHSLEKTTSTFIHILPPAVFHVITHRLPYEYKAARFPGSVKLANWKLVQGIVWASVSYFCWQSLYHYFITVRRKEKIKAGRATSFEYLRRAYAKKSIGRFVNGLPEPYPVVAFTVIQFLYQLSTMMFCPIWYKSEILSSIFLTFILLTASYNGATYYIDIFGKRFQKELLKLQAEVAEFQYQDENSPRLSPRLSPREQKDKVEQKNTDKVEQEDKDKVEHIIQFKER